MANRIASVGASTWTSGAFSGGAATVNGDEVFVPNGAALTHSAANTVVARSITVQAGGSFTMAATTSVMNLGDGTAGTGNSIIYVDAAATITLTGTPVINLLSTSATTQTITTNGKVLPTVWNNGVGNSIALADPLNTLNTADVGFQNGSFNTNNFAMNGGRLNFSSSGTRTVTLGSSAISAYSVTFGNMGGVTLTANTAVVTITNTVTGYNNIVVMNSFNWNGLSLVMSNANQCSINIHGATIKDLTINGTADQTSFYRISGSFTCTGTFTVNGNSELYRSFIYGVNLGSPAVITAGASNLSNVDFMDITGAGTATWTINSGVIGDRGGNTNITTTSGITLTRDSTPGNWSTAARWTGSIVRVPLPQDNVIFNSSSANTTVDVFAMGADISCVGYTGTWTRVSSNTPYSIFGSIELGAGMSMGVAPNTMYVEYRGRGSHTIKTNGVPHFTATSNQRVDMYNPGGTYTFLDPLTARTTSDAFSAMLTVQAGTTDFGPFTHTLGQFASSGTLTRTILSTLATFDLYSTSASAGINLNATNLTMPATSSGPTFNVLGVGPNNKLCILGGATIGTFNDVLPNNSHQISVTSSGSVYNWNVGPGRGVVVTQNQTLSLLNDPTSDGQPFGYQWMNGNGTSQGVSTPSSAALNLSSSFTLDAKILPGVNGSWNTSGTTTIINKLNTGLTAGYNLRIVTGGTLELFVNNSAANSTVSTSTVFANGQEGWIRAVFDDVNNLAFFYTSPDGVTWTQLGTSRPLAQAGVAASGTDLYIGQRFTSNDNYTGRVYQVRIYSDATQSTLAYHANFETKTLGADTFTESSSNAATVNITGTHRFGDGRVDWSCLTPGSQAFLSFPQSGRVTTVNNKYKDIRVMQPYTLYAGTTGVDGGNNLNLGFSAPPTGLYIEQAAYYSGSSNSPTATFPKPVTPGNTLVFVQIIQLNPGTYTPPPGFTLAIADNQSTDVYVKIYTKIADGSETVINPSWVTSRANDFAIYEIAGALGTVTLDGTDSNKSSIAANSISTGAGVSNTGFPGLAIATAGGAGTLGATVISPLPTNSFQEDYNMSAGRQRIAMLPLDNVASRSTTLYWTTPRTPISAMMILRDFQNTFKPRIIMMG